jgi:hypothetical protein
LREEVINATGPKGQKRPADVIGNAVESCGESEWARGKPWLAVPALFLARRDPCIQRRCARQSSVAHGPIESVELCALAAFQHLRRAEVAAESHFVRSDCFERMAWAGAHTATFLTVFGANSGPVGLRPVSKRHAIEKGFHRNANNHGAQESAKEQEKRGGNCDIRPQRLKETIDIGTDSLLDDTAQLERLEGLCRRAIDLIFQPPLRVGQLLLELADGSVEVADLGREITRLRRQVADQLGEVSDLLE